jgi:hypothetical protein
LFYFHTHIQNTSTNHIYPPSPFSFDIFYYFCSVKQRISQIKRDKGENINLYEKEKH